MQRLLILCLLVPMACTPEEPEATRGGLTGKALTWVSAGQASLDAGRYAEGLAWVDSALTLVPNRPEPHFLEGRLHAELNAYEEAEEAYARAAEIDPAYPGLWINRGNVAFARQLYRQALEAYRQETLREARVSHALGGTLEQLGEVDSALIAYRGALSQDPSYRPAAYSLSRLLETLGREAESLEAARTAAATPEAPTSYLLQRARLEVRMGNPEEGIEMLEDLTAREPWNYSALFALGQALQRQGRAGEATAMLQRADSLRAVVAESEKLELSVRDAPSPAAFARYGDALRRIGRTDEAIAAYRRAVGLSPANATIRLNLATLYLEAGREEEGLAGLRAVVDRNPEAFEGWINLALFHGRRGDLEQTRESLARAEAIDPDHPMVQRMRSALPD